MCASSLERCCLRRPAAPKAAVRAVERLLWSACLDRVSQRRPCLSRFLALCLAALDLDSLEFDRLYLQGVSREGVLCIRF